MIYDVIILGAGVVGCFIARELSRFNLKIALLDKGYDISLGATKANSGIVHGGYAEEPGTLKARLCYSGRIEFSRLERELSFGYRQTGSLVISFQPSDLVILEKLKEQGIKNGLPDSELQILSREEILNLEPNISPRVDKALYCRGAGVCSPYELALALAENGIANGVNLFLGQEVTGIQKEGGIFRTKTKALNNKNLPCPANPFLSRYAINCTGIQGDRISALAGEPYFSITPRKGEYILFSKGTGNLLNTVVFQVPTRMGKGVLVSSTFHGNLILGPDAQDVSNPDDTGTESERIREILEKAKLTTGKIDPKQFLRSFSGLRAVSSTKDFIVEETGLQGFINAAGIQSPGITSSPAIAERVIHLLSNSGLELKPRKDFRPERAPVIQKKELSMKQTMELANLTPGNPERILCKCEQVTEQEVRESLTRGIPVISSDGVKRRTRAGMGWCQGSFCRPRVAEVLQEVYGDHIIREEDIIHSGINRVNRKEFLELIEKQAKGNSSL